MSARPGKYLAIALLLAACSSAVNVPSSSPLRPIHLSLVHPLGTWADQKPRVAGVAFNLLDGRPEAVFGLALGPFINRTTRHMAGIQIAGLANQVGGTAFGLQLSGAAYNYATALAGIQLSGGVNRVAAPSAGLQLAVVWNQAATLWAPSERGFDGIQVAGFGNYADQLHGLQLSLFLNAAYAASGLQISLINFAGSYFRGLQIGGGNFSSGYWFGSNTQVTPDAPAAVARIFSAIDRAAMDRRTLENRGLIRVYHLLAMRTSYGAQIGLSNYASHLEGAQISAVSNLSASLSGVQFSVGANYSSHNLRGLQMTPLFNVALGYIEGVQLALVNFCRRLRGAQIGLINYCRQIRGIQLGLINIAVENRLPFMPILNIG